ncbi:MAG: fimbrial biogenesis outer membrane usher protein [Rhodocyclales bacterium]|nr:fimbrial biogenesis outer membrane usher protein [Rhodocyclales bacterium]
MSGIILATTTRGMAGEVADIPLDRPAVIDFATAGPSEYKEVWLAIRINGSDVTAPARLARLGDGHLAATAGDFARWRIRLPEIQPIVVKGNDYFPLDAVAGLRYRIDEREQVLVLDGQPEAFTLTTVATQRATFVPPGVAAAGGFFNYDLLANSQGGRHALDGLLEFGVFNRFGFGTSTFLGHGGDGKKRFIRLDTTWTRDEPSSLTSLNLGDNISRTGAWGRSVRFGGIQWGTNFATQPDFVPFPLPTLKGEAALPSTVDLYVDNALRLSQNVPYGPFEIPRAPLITGDGQVRLVVRDVLGRETIVTQPYTVSARLLSAGLHDYTYEAGVIRNKYAIESSDYSGFFAAGTHRAGLSDRLTGEIRGELLAKQQTLGVAASYLIPALGVASAATAVSHGSGGNGGFLSLGIERQGKPVSFGLETRLATPQFVQLGGWPTYDAPRSVYLARASFAVGHGGSAFVSYADQVSHNAANTKFITAGYSFGIMNNLYLSLFGLRSLGDDHAYSIGINVTYALGTRTTASASWNRDGKASSSSLQVQQSLPQGSGMGYRLLAGSGANARSEASLLLQNDIGTYRLEAAGLSGTTSYRAGASGGIAILDGRAYLARRLDDSFAVVQVGKYDDVDIFLENQPIARTKGGYALVTRLRPYQNNTITIQAESLPLDAEITTLRLNLSLSRRSAALVKFPVKPAHGALLRIIMENGAPLPAGALLTIAGGTEEFPVALRGEVYVKGLTSQNVVQAHWNGQSCDIEVTLPKDPGPLPMLGPFVCHGVKP